MKIVLPKYFLIGLCAYLMKIALSMDRSLGNLEEFRRYCSGVESISIDDVLVALRSKIHIIERRSVDLNYQYENKPVFIRLFEWLFKGGCSMDVLDLQHIYLILDLLREKLNDDAPLVRSDCIQIRLALSRAAITLSERFFFASRRAQILNVTHLNQNPNRMCNSIQAICNGRSWP